MSRIVSAWSCVLLAAAMIFPGCRKNQVPGAAAVPSGPDYDRTGQQLAFTSSASDPDEDSVAIRFDWGDGDTSGWSSSVVGGAAVIDSHAWSGADTYAVRAQARDSRGALSDWCSPHSLTIVGDSLPREPILEIPSVFVAGDTLVNEISVRDPDEDSVAVRVSWGDGDTTDWSELAHDGARVTFYHVWSDTGTMLVTAQARDAKGFTSDWSPARAVYVWRPKWRYLTGGKVGGCPAIGTDGAVYFGADDGYLYALDPNGALKWRTRTGVYGKSSPALATDGTVYIGSLDSCLYAVGSDGAIKWRFKTGNHISGSPALAADGAIYVASEDACLYAIDTNGVLKWSYLTGGRIMSSPAVAADGTVYVGSDDHYLYAVDPNGTLNWRCDLLSYTQSSPAIAADGTVYIGSNDGHLNAVNPSGTLRWRFPTLTPDAVFSSPAIGADGTVYVGSANCLYAATPNGARKWYFEAGFHILSSPAVAANGTVYFTSEDGYVYAVLNDSCKWRYVIGGFLYADPALGADGTVYAGSDDGYLYAIKGDSPLADSPWPKFRHDAGNTGRVGGGR
jgi:outer membrane protein assembly factor BamB